MHKENIRIILFYSSPLALLTRFILVNLLLVLLFFQIIEGNFPHISLFLMSIFLIIEIFMKYGIGRIIPLAEISQKPQNKYDSFTKQALESVLYKKNSVQFLKYVLKFPQSQFIIHKSAIDKKEVNNSNLSLEDLASKAFDICINLKGKYVTTGDLMCAYLLLTEPETKLLFDKQLKEIDLININNWSKISVDEENVEGKKIKFEGMGFGETLVWGWTPETKKYTKDHTLSHIKHKTLIEGREAEYQLLLDSMQKPQNNNILIVGELGSGKSNLVENFIFESYEGRLPKKLNHRRFLELMVGPFIAGAGNRDDLEIRLQSVIDEVMHSGNVILYIPQFQNLMGSDSFEIDLSGAILPYLRNGKMPIIATMTKGEYKKYFENNALREVFEVILLEEPKQDIALKMLFQKTIEIEEQNHVYLSYSAVRAGVRYADKYEPNAVLPGTAVDLLNASSNSIRISRGKNSVLLESDVKLTVEQKSKIPVGTPSSKEKMFLLNLENEMHKFIIGQNEAISSISEAIRRIRAGLAREKPISFLFLGPTGVGKTETAKTLAKLYFGGEAQIIRLDMSEYGNPDSLSRMLESGSGTFLDNVMTHPFSLILLDEFEKADPKILNLFLQVFDDGRMTDKNGKTVSFSDAIIIATSNAGSEFIRENLAKNTNVDNKNLLDFLQRKGTFTPELLNRFDELVVFKPLTTGEITEITRLVINELAGNLAVQDIILTVTPQALAKISHDGFDQEFGARPLRRFVQSKLEDEIAKKILAGEINRGDKIVISIGPDSGFVFNKN
jgi:ATP-dependent Clp protease ATP-binding subunit ClpC